MKNYFDALYVFDLDGVITNPIDTSVNSEVVAHIYNILSDGGYIAVNTGRSYKWVEQNLVTLLQVHDNVDLFTHLYIVCEKGGESMVRHNGEFKGQPSRFALDKRAYDATKQAFTAHEREFTTMFWDATKRTMASIEKEPCADLSQFHEQQQYLVDLLKQNVQRYDARVDATTIATDIESPKAGKHAGAELIYEWVAHHALASHDTFVCFGDSTSDYEMARYFAQQGADTSFIFVGKPTDSFSEDERVKTIRTAAQYDQGTLEYFQRSHADE